MIRKLFGGMMCTAMLCLILCTAVMANWERCGDGAFAYCTELRNVTVPFGTKTIGKNAFCNCANLSRAELPSSLTEIGAYVFLLCPGLTDIFFAGTKAQWDKIEKNQWDVGIPEDLDLHFHHTITFDANGHGTAPKPTYQWPQNTIVNPGSLSSIGYIFTGWYRDKGCTQKWDFANDKVEGDMTLYAGWEEDKNPGIFGEITISKKPVIKKPAASRNKIIVKWKHFRHTSKKAKKIWKKIRKVQVQCAVDSNFNNIVKSFLTGKSRTSAAIKGLQKNTIYFVRVRYFDGTGCSAWSKTRRIKTKK